MSSAGKRTQIYLTEEQHRAASALARRKGISLAAVVREALGRYIATEQSAGETEWQDDPALALVGKLELPELPRDVDLSDAIDRVVYEADDEGVREAGGGPRDAERDDCEPGETP